MKEKRVHHSLFLEDLSLQVRLGCTEEERRAPQEVRLSIEFRFETPPGGYESDRLEETVCYAQVSDKLKSWIESREYKLIERIAADGYRLTKELAGRDVGVAFVAHKVRPPVPSLQGGTKYRCGDFPA